MFGVLEQLVAGEQRREFFQFIGGIHAESFLYGSAVPANASEQIVFRDNRSTSIGESVMYTLRRVYWRTKAPAHDEH